MSLSSATRSSTKWLWQQALIRAGGQDIATQSRERRIGCSSINDWLPASSRFSEIVCTAAKRTFLCKSSNNKFLCSFSLFFVCWTTYNKEMSLRLRLSWPWSLYSFSLSWPIVSSFILLYLLWEMGHKKGKRIKRLYGPGHTSYRELLKTWPASHKELKE